MNQPSFKDYITEEQFEKLRGVKMTGLGNIDDVYKHYLVVIEENQQLKELLKECREIFIRTAYTHKFDMVTKIDNAIGEKK